MGVIEIKYILPHRIVLNRFRFIITVCSLFAVKNHTLTDRLTVDT
jgi:hypothetical protein